MRLVICARCGKRRPHKALGYCSPCYRYEHKTAHGWQPRETAPCRFPGCKTETLGDGLDICSPHLKDELGITYRQLDYWARQGYVRPAEATPGSGNARVWPPAEIEIARRIGFLAAASLPLAQAARFAREDWPRGEIAPGITIEVTGQVPV